MKRKVQTSIIVLMAGNFLTFLFYFLAARIIAHTLSPSDYGIYQIVTFYIILAQHFTNLGINKTIIKFYAQYPKQIGKYFWNNIYLQIILGTITYIPITIIAIILHKYEVIPLLMIMSYVLILSFAIKSAIDSLQQLTHNNYSRALSETLSGIFKLLTFFYVSKFYPTITAFAIAVIGTGVISLILDIVLFFRNIPFPPHKLEINILKTLFTNTFFTGLTAISNMSLKDISTAVLDHTADIYYTGIYSLTKKIMSIILIVPNTVMIPLYTEINKTDHNKLKGKLINYTKFMLLISSTIAIITILFAKMLVYILGGAQYNDAVIALQIASLSLPFSFLHHLYGYSLIALNLQKQYFFYSFFTACANIALLVILTISLPPQIGAAIALIITEALITILTGIKLFKFIKPQNENRV